jgi:antitoxin ParD1/3/4
MANFTLKPEQESFVQAEIGSGKYQTIDEVIEQALTLLEQRNHYEQWVAETQAKIDVAAEQLELGEAIDGTTAMAQLRKRLHGQNEVLPQ